jgi:peptidoglycan/xylan/chitin deacetylase (PgdA/CDA1 family)
MAAALLGGVLPDSAAAGTERPPQFVALSYDNCSELERWQELSEFLDEMNRDGERVRLTFFVSGTNFLAFAKRGLYRPPGRAPGSSNINFGGSDDDVVRRIGYINRLRAAGHEIASHAVGHFDGKGWSAADWTEEFRAYNELLDGIAANHGLGEKAGFAFPAKEVVGFRAPYLSRNGGLYATLQARRFRYDASGTGAPDAWPEKIGGVWRFNLAEIRLAGTGRRTLSMDYNFFVVQSLAISDPRRHAQFREQMLKSYLDYFRANYAGNRAPIHIGHHFSNFQGGVYNEALLAFARIVCGLPEVRCVSYVQLAAFMDGLDEATLRAYRTGDFPRIPAPAVDLEGVSRRAGN